MSVLYEKPKSLNESPFTFCPGCTHGIIVQLVTSVIDELGIGGDTICVGCVGCGGYLPWFMATDTICSLHGRAPANATGIKRMQPDKVVFTYQGDGDLVSEGMSEIMHSAIRGEKFTVVFVNNAIYGMTGGQMAPTTLMGQHTTTSPYGRGEEFTGHPVNMAEIIAGIPGCYYSERVTVSTPANIRKMKAAIKKAFTYQLEGKGLSFVEVVSPCPTGWGVKPVEALKWVDNTVLSTFPLGVFKAPKEEGK